MRHLPQQDAKPHSVKPTGCGVMKLFPQVSCWGTDIIRSLSYRTGLFIFRRWTDATNRPVVPETSVACGWNRSVCEMSETSVACGWNSSVYELSETSVACWWNSSMCELCETSVACGWNSGAMSLARPTSWCILFDGGNISFDASLVIYINSTNIPPIMIINRIYETQNLLSL